MLLYYYLCYTVYVYFNYTIANIGYCDYICNMNFNKIVLLHTIYNHSNYILMETNVNQRILKIKKNEKLTNETLSQRANVSVETIKSMFSKKTNPNIDTIARSVGRLTHSRLS